MCALSFGSLTDDIQPHVRRDSYPPHLIRYMEFAVAVLEGVVVAEVM